MQLQGAASDDGRTHLKDCLPSGSRENDIIPYLGSSFRPFRLFLPTKRLGLACAPTKSCPPLWLDDLESRFDR